MPNGRARWALAVLALLVVLGTGAGWYAQAHRPPPVTISTVPNPAATLPDTASAPSAISPFAAKPAPAQMYYVHVAGAVRHPALYSLPPNSRVWHAIKAAGGATPKADLDALNLAEKVHDGEKVYVPTHAAVTAQPPPPVAAAVVSPFPSAAPAAGKVGKIAGKAAKLSSPAQGQVNINSANADELQRLPGIGPAMAARILAYRQQAGRFATTDELMQVSGIGPKKYAKIAPLVKL